MSHQTTLQDIIRETEQAVSSFNRNIPLIQRDIYNRLLVLLKDLELSGDQILNSVENIRRIGQLKVEIERIIISEKYIDKVGAFTKAFETVSILQNNYFSSLVRNFKTSAVMKALQRDAITSTVESLTKSGITANVTEGIQGILRTNITTGGSYAQLTEQLREFILGSPDNLGALERYTKTITIDAINTYSRTRNEVIAMDLGFTWYAYSGTLLETSREWCKHMVKKYYVHKSELQTVISGNIDGVAICSEEIPCNNRTGLPRGMKKETNAGNVVQLAGGWRCRHAILSIPDINVPKAIRDRLNGQN